MKAPGSRDATPASGIFMRIRRMFRMRWPRGPDVRDRAGGVTLEYVILAVLIAAAVVLAVVVFSRSVATMFFAAYRAA